MAQATVDVSRVAQRTDPTFLGVGSSTYGANPLGSPAQAAAEQRLDARFVRLPVGYRNGRVTTSAAGTNGTLDIPALVRLYRSWGYRVIAVVGGRTSDWDVQPGDATQIFRALGRDGIDYTPSNEPDNQGKNVTDVSNQARMIYDEGVAVFGPDFKLWGPVLVDWWGSTTSGTRGFINQYMVNMGGPQRLAGIDFHSYGAGMGAGPTQKSTESYFQETPNKFGQMMRDARSDARSKGLPDVPGNVNLDEMNFRWIFEGDPRFFMAVNTVWMTSALGHCLSNGGRVMPYATQNGALGVMVEQGNNDQGRPASSPMPAFWAIAAFTGAKTWPHYKDSFYPVSSDDPSVETFAVNNEAGGVNLVVVNKNEWIDKSYTAALPGLKGTATIYQSRKDFPYDQPVRTVNASAFDGRLSVQLPACTIAMIVLSTSTTPAPTQSPTPPASVSLSSPALAPDGTYSTIASYPPVAGAEGYRVEQRSSTTWKSETIPGLSQALTGFKAGEAVEVHVTSVVGGVESAARVGKLTMPGGTTPAPTPAPAPAPTPVQTLGLPLLARGSTDRDGNRTLQGLLMARGHAPSGTVKADGTVDGVFGSGTETAVKKFQTSVGISASGKTDDNTWRKLLRL